MLVKIKPSVPSGTVMAPPSKSMAHRLLICAGLAEGESVIENIALSQDILATLDCLEALGAEIKREEGRITVKGADLKSFTGGNFPCRESGSTIRFFIPLAMLTENKSLFTGYGRLLERPMDIYCNLADEKGLFYEHGSDGIRVSGKLEGGEFKVRADVSSQFVSGLLFALPLAQQDSRIILEGKIESHAYIDMTVEALNKFGIQIEKENENTFYIKGTQKYKCCHLRVEGDFSNAAFLDAFSLLGGDLTVIGLEEESLQGDKVYKEYFELLKKGAPVLDVSQCPDLAPVLMTLAAALNGATLKGTSRLKLKESDRGAVMKEELSKFGAITDISENEITVKKSKLHTPEETLCGHNDHRVVMSLAVLCSVYGGEIQGAESIDKSYPDFFYVMKNNGLEAETVGNK